MSNIYRGVGCHWGVGSSTGVLVGKLQTRDHTRKSDKDTIRDADGVEVSAIYYDPNEEATFEAVVTGSAGVGDATPTMPANGDVVTITDTKYTQISGSATGTNVWLVDDVSTKSGNTSAMRISLKLSRYSGVVVA